MGWRYLMFTLGAICLFVFFLRFVVFRFQESPKYLLYRGKDEKAVEVLHHIAKFNGRQCDLTLEVLAALTDEDSSLGSAETGKPVLGGGAKQTKSSFGDKVKIELARYKLLFANPLIARLTILVWITYMFDYWGFSIAGTSIPLPMRVDGLQADGRKRFPLTYHLARKEPCHRSVNCTDLPELRDHLYLWYPRRAARSPDVRGSFDWTAMGHGNLVRTDGCVVVSLLRHQHGSEQCRHQHHGVLLPEHVQRVSPPPLGLEDEFHADIICSILYGWTPEAYPAPIRGTACGVASFWGRLFSIVSPLIGTHLLATNVNGPLYLAGSGVFVCTICLILMPRKYMGSQSY